MLGHREIGLLIVRAAADATRCRAEMRFPLGFMFSRLGGGTWRGIPQPRMDALNRSKCPWGTRAAGAEPGCPLSQSPNRLKIDPIANRFSLVSGTLKNRPESLSAPINILSRRCGYEVLWVRCGLADASRRARRGSLLFHRVCSIELSVHVLKGMMVCSSFV